MAAHMREKLCCSDPGGSASQPRRAGHGSGTWSTGIDSGVPSSSSVRRTRLGLSGLRHDDLERQRVDRAKIVSLVRTRIFFRAGQNAIENAQIVVDEVIDVGLSNNCIHPAVKVREE
jgi:hypothetical protein